MEIIFLQKWKVRMVYCDNKGSMIFLVNGNRNRNGNGNYFLQKLKVRMVYCDNKGSMIFRVNGNRNRNGNYFFTETESRNGILLDMELE